MMRRSAGSVLVGLLCAVAQGALAQDVTIRSGNHDRFARLVLSIPAGTDWRLGRDRDGYLLDLGASVGEISLESAFDRIPRDRIADLAAGPDGQLSIALACDCHADAFLWRQDRLVVDIVDGPPDPASEFERSLAASGPELSPAAAAPPAPRPRAPDDALFPVVFDRQTPGGDISRPARPALVARPLPAGQPNPLAPTAPRSTTDTPEMSAAERAILESLARAASQGLLDIGQPDGPERRSEVVLPTDPAPVPQFPGQPQRPGVTARTSLDLAMPSAVALDCVDADLFDISAWVDPQDDFAQRIGALRRALSDGPVDPDPAVLEDLARSYLYFGFGREAVEALAQTSRRSSGYDVLEQLARIIDGDPIEGRVRWQAEGCGGGAILWAALAGEDIAAFSETDRRAAVRAFGALPDHLRAHLAPRFAEILAAAGEMVSAEALINAASAPGTDVAPDLPVAASTILRETEGTAAAIDRLTAQVQPQERLLPDGLAELMSLHLEQDGAIPEGLRSLAASMRAETRGTATGGRLAELEVEGLILADRFAQALDLLESSPDLASPDRAETRDRLRADAVLRMAAVQSDSDFLEMAFGPLSETAGAEAANAVAARLMTFGFAERVLQLVAGPATGPQMAERRYLRAEAAAMLGDAARVDRALQGLSSDRAERIRASVAGVPSDPGPGPGDAVQTSDDPLLLSAASALQQPTTPLTGAAPLAERRAILAETAETRARVTDLLDRFTLDPPDP